eukprot:CAMPEP_0194781420 /NCGR_PEP_ID=MMETSP0323_2-20130528/76231_1 /TAXON_ID=2866 ORGANISM="Crypthecodinium cohnii, Strain Seligo" /NCGR_SAMPLE_ID=MMETSP0323_2 /ASSEMBLY_ACC=CAM_ASM_000346 /LENGTH=60 /DNA_ID=CAMNT_0039719815 /DNA_START=55 /DNA_END=233 /DNA_ORIENTATION=+
MPSSRLRAPSPQAPGPVLELCKPSQSSLSTWIVSSPFKAAPELKALTPVDVQTSAFTLGS